MDVVAILKFEEKIRKLASKIYDN